MILVVAITFIIKCVSICKNCLFYREKSKNFNMKFSLKFLFRNKILGLTYLLLRKYVFLILYYPVNPTTGQLVEIFVALLGVFNNLMVNV